MDISDSAITKPLDDYFDVLYFQDMELFNIVFNRDSIRYSTQGDILFVTAYGPYQEAVANRTAPAHTGDREDVGQGRDIQQAEETRGNNT